ncbi:VOC family protein [Paenibacillus sp. J5C_2022]|uniref:VOC family protein n=1 Tax=Paenibacillus sp. J5C2022 TaxID=2977129 RepID=UPI0021D30FEC|nr:VOC family protein [Paenibacillus sp. J5C2022]MCU6710001.1 VOC family protein [Paenibacillus sp. J5C2022]
MSPWLGIHHIGIETDNMEQSRHFYEKLLGFRLERRLTWRDEQLVFLKQGDVLLELVGKVQSVELSFHSAPRTSAAMHLALEVEDVIKLVEQLHEQGIPVIDGPHELQNGWIIAFIEGPSGELIECIEV